MILTCPSCSVRYLVDARALGLKGRMVRCARCGHTWTQVPPPEEALAAAPPVPAATAEKPAAPQAAASEEPAPRRAAAAPLAAERRIQLPALPRRKRRWGLALAWTVTALAIVAALSYAAAVERDRIVALVPAAAGLYARIGLAPEPIGTGLEFRNIATSRDIENGVPALVVSGEVTNVSTIAREVPKLVVILRDKSEHDLQNATISLDAHRLGPGETVPFHTTISQPADAAAGVVVTFAGVNPG